MQVIGITTTVPSEVLLAAGYNIVDLNNLFIGSEDYSKHIEFAENTGFPKSSCAWIKGIYSVCVKNSIKKIVGVLEGDCSNTRALIDVLKLTEDIEVYPFSYPSNHDSASIKASIQNLMDMFNVDEKNVETIRRKLKGIREKTKMIDRLTYEDEKATGFENHLYQVMASDFNGDAVGFEKMLENKIEEIVARTPSPKKIRLGYIGVPPMTADIYNFVEEFDARFYYNEVQREFAFPRAYKAKNIYEQYYDYTYPFDIDFRIAEIKRQIETRKLDAVIHYTQVFCFRAIEDIVIKKGLGVPVLTVEGDKLNYLDQRIKLRIEAFLDMICDLKRGCYA